MKRNTAVLALLFLAMGLCLCPRVEAQVSVTRELPQSGAKQGQATWRAPYPESAAIRTAGATQLSGRISVGGRGGQDTAGNTLYDVATDSQLTLIRPLGAGALSFDAAALRTRSADDENQEYSGALGLDFERLQLAVSGGYSQSLKPVEDVDTGIEVDKGQRDAFVEASLSSGMLETLPMKLSYKSTWNEASDDATRTESSRSDNAVFRAAGTVGRLGLEIGASLDYEDDRELASETLGTNADILLSVPLAETLSLQATALPNFNRSESATASLSSTSLEYGLGILWSALADLETRLQASRVDSWAEGSGVAYQPYQTTWKAGIAADYQPPAGLFGGASYNLAKTVDGNISHELSLPLGWRGKDGFVRQITAGTTADLTRDSAGGRVKDTLDWDLSVNLVPAQSMSWNSSYMGGYVYDTVPDTATDWNHQVKSSFSHSPDPLLDYRASFSLSNNLEEEAEELWKQEYQAGLTLKPQWNLKLYNVDLSETVAVANGGTGEDILSTATLNLSIPLARALATRYGAQWEWINRTAPGAEPGSNFRYNAGLSVAGEAVPFTFNAEYALSHGYRGVRHDVSSAMHVPFQRGFALEGVFTLSSYEEDGDDTLPFLAGLNLVYEF